MNKDIRVLVSFRNSTKRKKLDRLLGSAGVVALIDLWAYAAENHPGGVLTKMSVDDIEIAVDWRGEPGALISALVNIGFVDFDGREYQVHDWIEHNPYVVGAETRSKKGTFSNLKRWHPEIARRLESKGIRSVTRKEFQLLTTIDDYLLPSEASQTESATDKTPLNGKMSGQDLSNVDTESVTDRLTDPPSPYPLPLPTTEDTTSSLESTKTEKGAEILNAPEDEEGMVVLGEVSKLHFQAFGSALTSVQAEALKAFSGQQVMAKYREALERKGTADEVKSFKWIKIGLENGMSSEKPGFFKRIFGGADEDRQKGYRVDVG